MNFKGKSPEDLLLNYIGYVVVTSTKLTDPKNEEKKHRNMRSFFHKQPEG